MEGFRQMSKRWFTMVPTAALALAVLAACGGTAPETGDVTRVPDAANAPATEAPADDAATDDAATDEGTAEATDAATEEATEAATEEAATDAAASPAAADDATPAAAIAADEATPAAASADEATPAAAADEATPAAAMSDAATPAAAAADEATPAVADEATPAADGATPEAAAGDAAMQEFTVVSRDIFFDPKELTIPADTEVLIHLPNEGAAPHNFVIEELGVRAEQAPGEEHEITLTAPAGTYDYICDIPGHKEAGMVGVLTVE